MEVVKMSNNTKYVRDAFKSLELVEDKEFDLFGKDSFEELGDFIDTEDDVEVEQEVIDLDANEPEELKDSYVGDVILSCPVCHANMFKEIGDVVIDEETELCCVGDPCPVCGQEDGFKVIGKVAPFEEVEEEEETEVDVETEPEEAEAEVEVKEKVRESFKKRVADKRLQEKRTPAHRKLMEKVCKDCGKEVCECDKEEKPAKKPIRIKATGNMVEIPIEKKDRPLKEEKGDLNKLDKDIQDIVGDHFGYTMNFDFLDIVADVLLRVDDFDNEDQWDTVDSTLIYADDQWEVLEHYFDSPADLSDGSWDDAFAQFVGDIEEICGKVAAQRGGEEVSESKKLEEAKLSKSDREYLRKLGETEDEDIDQIEYAVGKTIYTLVDENGKKKKISAKKAREILGDEKFLSGLQRSAFHWDSSRKSDDGITVRFDSSAIFRESKDNKEGKKLSESKYQIKEVSSDEARDIINNRKPLGLFLQKDGNVFVAIDNSTGDAWTEEFKDRKSAEKWLLTADESLKKPNSGKKLSEAPVYDLNPQFDSRKSFYNKAKVDTGDKGDKNKLYSYNTLVAELKDGKPVVYGTFSSTTLRHIKDWLKQLGFKADNAKQIMADYGVKEESLKESDNSQSNDNNIEKQITDFIAKIPSTGQDTISFKSSSGEPVNVTVNRGGGVVRTVIKCANPRIRKEIYFLSDNDRESAKGVENITDLINNLLAGNAPKKGSYTAWGGDQGRWNGRESFDESLEDIKSEWKNMRRGNIFEFPSGDYVHVGIDFDKKTIYAGGATNTGIFRDTEIDLDEDDSLDGNLMRLYDAITEEHPEYFETDESLKEDALTERKSDFSYLTHSEKLQYVIDNFKKITGRNIKGVFNRGAESDEFIFNQDFIDATYDKIDSFLKKNGMSDKEVEDFIYDLDAELVKIAPQYIGESLKEDIEKATIETEDQVIKVSSEPKEEDMNADWFDRESMGEGELLPDDGEEMIAPLDDEDIAEIEAAQEEPEENAEEPAETEEENPEDEEEFEFDEIQEESFKRITESYLKKVYSNVRSFKINNLDVNENLLRIDGTIRFNSGKKKDTAFVFESAKNENTIAKSKKRFVGLNETFTDKKDAFVLNTVVNNKKFIAESLSYDYPAKTKDLNESVKTVKGIVK